MSKLNLRWAVSLVSTLVIVGVLTSCKPSTPAETLTEEQKQTRATQEAEQWVDYGFSQLMAEDDVASESDSFGLAFPGGQKKSSPNPFTKIIKNVQNEWQKVRKNPCSVWKPLLKSSNGGLLRPYFFTGLNAEAGVGLHGITGRDFVWDFYNLQFASFTYNALEAVLGSGTAGAGVNSYLGLAFGVREDVNQAWSGQFLSTGAAVSLPVLSDYLSVHGNYFTAANKRGELDPSFIGATVGVSFAVSVPTALPAAIQISHGSWDIDSNMNKSISERLKSSKIPNSIAGRETCQGRCVRFDSSEKGKGYTGRMANLLRSFPSVLTLNKNTSFGIQLEKMVLLGLATAAYRDTVNAAYLCRK